MPRWSATPSRVSGERPSGALSTQERALYLKARRLLAAELGVATATDEAQADAWIEGQLEASANENETE